MKKWSTIQAFQFDDVVIEEWFDYGGKPHRTHLTIICTLLFVPIGLQTAY
jgi:hypothetical protein